MLGVFLDTETTGLDPFFHAILEIAIKVVDLSNGNLCGSFSSVVRLDPETFHRADSNSLRVNGFTYEMLQGGKPMQQVQEEITLFLKEAGVVRGSAVFICQNPSFDRSFFSQLIDVKSQEKMRLPYHWLDLASMFFGVNAKQATLPWGAGLSKDHIARFLQLPKEKSPHRAMQGVDHLILCYEKLIGFTIGKEVQEPI